MEWQFSPYFIPYLASAVIALVVIVLTRPRHRVPTATPLCVTMVAVAWWSLGNMMELGSLELQAKFFWAGIQYLAIATLPVFWLILAAHISAQPQWLTRRNLALLCIVPALTQIVFWTNPFHNLMYQDIYLDSSGPFPVMMKLFGPWVWFHIFYSYSLMAVGSWMLVAWAVRHGRPYQGQAVALVAAALFPWVSNLLHVLHLDPIPTMDLTPPTFALSGLLVALALFRYRLLDLVPVAHDTLFAEMRDGVVALDDQGRVVDLNPAAERIFGRTTAQAVGLLGRELVPHQFDWVQKYRGVTEARDEIELGPEGQRVPYDLLISPLLDRRGQVQGRLIVLRDVAARKQAEAERERLIGELQHALAEVRQLSGLLPICASCKKIRDDQGYWQVVEEYLEDHSQAEFSHGFCPECAERLYGDYLGPEKA